MYANTIKNKDAVISMSKDSYSYCAKCKKKPTCSSLCYPVEHLLESVTTQPTEPSIDYADQLEVSPHEAFVPPITWTSKSTKRKVFELCIIDKITHQQASIMVGVTRPRVTQIVSEIFTLIDKL
jgi:hypothetical protein